MNPPKKRVCRCGNEFTNSKGRRNRRCDVCVFSKVWEKKFEDLKSDASKKSRLIKEFGHKCWECGIEKWNGKPAPLQLDHINGNTDDSSRENLRILCANCHAMTPTFCSKNKGHPGTKRKVWRNNRNGAVV